MGELKGHGRRRKWIRAGNGQGTEAKIRSIYRYIEEKAKAVVWGTEFIQFLAALAILHQDYMKPRMNCTRISVVELVQS